MIILSGNCFFSLLVYPLYKHNHKIIDIICFYSEYNIWEINKENLFLDSKMLLWPHAQLMIFQTFKKVRLRLKLRQLNSKNKLQVYILSYILAFCLIEL